MSDTAIITYYEIFSDSSGAPALIEYKGRKFSADYIGGELSVKPLNAVGNAAACRKAIRHAEDAYKRFIEANTTAAWRWHNQEIYKC